MAKVKTKILDHIKAHKVYYGGLLLFEIGLGAILLDMRRQGIKTGAIGTLEYIDDVMPEVKIFDKLAEHVGENTK